METHHEEMDDRCGDGLAPASIPLAVGNGKVAVDASGHRLETVF
jgi:hypothetical protein